MTNAGIDYGLGKSNIDTATGIRYGVISTHSVGERLYDAQQFEYPDDADEYSEPIGWHVKDDDYMITQCLDTDAMILKSPYYTFAQFCSPCVPGAGNLDHPMENGVKTYCLDASWFENDRAPYPVFRVADDRLVTL
jgi:hypothetical protein